METDAEASGIQSWLFGSVRVTLTTIQTHRFPSAVTGVRCAAERWTHAGQEPHRFSGVEHQDGRVTATELLQGLSSPGCSLEAWRQMEQIKNRADADGDGRVSRAELERMLVARQTAEPMTQLPPATATDGTHGCIVSRGSRTAARACDRSLPGCPRRA